MVKYQVINLTDRDSFEKTIAYYLAQGWELQGGVSVVRSRTSQGERCILYVQAITRVEHDEQWIQAGQYKEEEAHTT